MVGAPPPTKSPTNDGLPLADSLLFSANPTHIDPYAASFQPSRYQATPPPGTWGNMPWGAGWEERGKRPPSPCIFEYGRGGSEPLLLDTTTSTGTSTSTLPITRNRRGEEDYTQYTEDCLPGSIYYYDDDPSAPTANKVANYRQSLLEDLGLFT